MTQTKVLTFIFIFFSLVACQTITHEEYVKVEIPTSLQDNEKAKALLNTQAKNINKILNSAEDMLVGLEDLGEAIENIDFEKGEEEIAKGLEKSASQMAKIQGRLVVNASYYTLRIALKQEEMHRFEETLSGTTLADFKNVKNSLKLDNDLVNQKMEECDKLLEEFEQIIQAKEKEFEAFKAKQEPAVQTNGLGFM